MLVRAFTAFSLPTLHFFGEGCPLRLARLETPRPKHRLRIVSREEVSAQLLGQKPPDPLICTSQLWLRAPRNLFSLSTEMVSVISETGRCCKKKLVPRIMRFSLGAVKRVAHC